MYFTDWAWRAFVREFRQREGISLLALAYISDFRLRAALGTDDWWTGADVAAITGLSPEQTREHLFRLHKRGLVEHRPSVRLGKPHYWRMPEAARKQKGAVPRTRAS
jgi:predicted transcriptional regulator of viral defense system